MHFAGIAFTLGSLWLMWSVRGKLTSHGFEYVHWVPASQSSMVRAAAAGIGAGMLVAWLFGGYDKSASPMFTDVWMAITLGPLAEELIFRGYLFWVIGSLLARLKVCAGAATAFVVAVLFALAHASKSGITGPQLVTIFGTGLLYGWLRLDYGSTVPPVIAHILFNAVIYLAAVFV